MNKFNHYIIQFLKYASPLVLIAVIGSIYNYGGNSFIYELTGWTTIIWTACLIYIVFAVAFNEQLKNKFVRRLAGIKENDEREVQVTGKISKKVFISMTGIFVLLLFLSALRINIYRMSNAEAANGKHGTVQIGMGLSITPEEKTQSPEDASRNYIIKYNGLPLSADGVLLLVIALQLGSFYYFSRKENKLLWE